MYCLVLRSLPGVASVNPICLGARMNRMGMLGLALWASMLGSQLQAAQIQGLPASDVLGSEDLYDNPTFVGGVINGGPSASSEY